MAGRPLFLRYVVALVIVCAVAAARLAAAPVLGMQAPLLPFAVAILAVAYVCGLGPALLATVASALLATAFYIDFRPQDSAFAWIGHVTIFVILGGLVSLMMHRLQRVYRTQHEALAVANAREAQLRLIADELEDSQKRLSLALRAGRSGTFDWDVATSRMSWSEELHELHGFKQGEFSGTEDAWEACIHPDDFERVLAALERALTDGELIADYRIRRHDTGEVRWLHCRGTVSRDEERRPVRMIGINVDVTEQKRAEEALREADRRKDEFLAMLAHELRNPLAPIRYVAHLLAHGSNDRATVRRNVDILSRQVAHLSRLLDDLLDAARIRRGMMDIKREPLYAESALQRAIETVQGMLGEKRQSLHFTPAEQPLPVRGDAVRLEQVFVNLLSNASKYSPQRSAIDVSAEMSDSEAIIRVRDWGSGIDPQLLPRVFDLFLQADQSLDRPHGGLGVGLTIVKRIVELHGGHVEAHSEGLGHGSEFVVHLPLAVAEEQPAARARPYPSVARRVLVVEDNHDSAQMLGELLKSDGHEVSIAGNGAEALRQLDSFAPEFILMDIGLPGMDGYAVAELMRQRESGSSARMYALTGYGYAEDRAMAFRSGFDGHLSKPVDPERLLRLLADALPDRVTSRSGHPARF